MFARLETMALNMAMPGETVQVTSIRLDMEARRQLQRLGVDVDTPIHVLKRTSFGHIIVAVAENSWITIPHNVARKITVKLADS